MILVAVLFIVLVINILLQYVRSESDLKNYKLPPGPKRWPLVGSLPSLVGKVALEKFQDWADIYGGIYFCKIGLQKVVVVTDSKVMHNMCVTQAERFSIRPKELLLGKILGGKGIPFNDGTCWKEHRTFVVQEFRKFGLTKSSVESRIQEEVQVFLDKLSVNCGKQFNMHYYLATVTYNIIWSVISGQRFDWDDQQLTSLVKNLEANLQAVEILGAHNYSLPLMLLQLLRNNPPKLLSILISRFKYFNRLINSSELSNKTFENEEFSENMISDYLMELREKKKANAETTFSKTQLLFTVSDLFVAGGETTITTLQWDVLFLALHQDWQQKIREEILSAFGKDRLPSYTERDHCPSLEAFINEALRYRTATAAMWHSTTETSQVAGYDIPANTWVLMHFQGMHHNKEQWPDPDVFKPERFLSNGVYVKNESFLPFSCGRRQCPGESLARTELFIVLASLVQHFKISFPVGTPIPSLRGTFGVTLGPDEYQVVLERCE